MEYRYKQEDKYELPQHSHYPNQNTDTCIAKGQIQYPMVHWANGGHFNDLHANINPSNISIIRKLNNLGLAVLGQTSGVFPPTLSSTLGLTKTIIKESSKITWGLRILFRI